MLSIIREATSKSKDGRIDQSDFLNHCAASTRYALFTPMEASIIFHFAARGDSSRRLALIDFAQLLDPRWQAPARGPGNAPIEASTTMNIVHEVAHSIYNFMLGGKCLKRLFRRGSVELSHVLFLPFRCRGCIRCNNCVPY